MVFKYKSTSNFGMYTPVLPVTKPERLPTSPIEWYHGLMENDMEVGSWVKGLK